MSTRRGRLPRSVPSSRGTVDREGEGRNREAIASVHGAVHQRLRRRGDGMTERRVVERRGGLGRGLAALIPTGPPAEAAPPLPPPPPPPPPARPPAPDPTAILFGGPRPVARPVSDVPRETSARSPYYREIDVTGIEPNPQQPRSVFDEESLAELEHSIREFGLLQPVVVRESGPNRYQ